MPCEICASKKVREDSFSEAESCCVGCRDGLRRKGRSDLTRIKPLRDYVSLKISLGGNIAVKIFQTSPWCSLRDFFPNPVSV